ncbi:hypothetical protein NPIL_554421 [Nephila pilipes]|uniref:Uncharacterized protein n=1 Tax=Nephila pilipes TaxID=299642 RepID=A0A8X6NYQ8_NEPPI|nr:hypothetical protein NPIL_554421 [Nephila pilipes]
MSRRTFAGHQSPGDAEESKAFIKLRLTLWKSFLSCREYFNAAKSGGAYLLQLCRVFGSPGWIIVALKFIEELGVCRSAIMDTDNNVLTTDNSSE